MKLSISRSSALTWVVVAVLLAALPLAVWEFIKTGEFYLFSPRFLRHMAARLSGPGRLRFILQPAAAILLGSRDGVKDARAGAPPFLSALLFYRTGQAGVLRSGLASVRNLVCVAILLDVLTQFLMFRMVHPGAALILGPVLIATPYALSRAVGNRIARPMRAEGPTTQAS